MAANTSKELEATLHKLTQTLSSHDYKQCPALLSRAKISLLSLNALTPQPGTPSSHLTLARQTLELGALISIRLEDPDAFTRYYTQLSPFYALPSSTLSSSNSQQSKITGLYLLLLLTKGDYAGFHTCLESLMIEDAAKVEGNVYISYPVKLEQWLMEGAYDRVWEVTTKKGGEPSEEFGVFSGVLIHTIRSEIASCSEKAYPSLPISNAKNLLFLESEGAVVQFAKGRGWSVRDGRIWFEDTTAESLDGAALEGRGAGAEMMAASGAVIENTIGYARELETIV